MTLRAALYGLGLLAFSAGPSLAQSANHGRDVFDANCSTCHSVAAKAPNMMGPSLNGVVGRKAGALPGFSYSPAMSTFGQTWTPELLDSYLTAPAKLVPGIKMPFPGLPKAQDRADVIAFLSAAAQPGATTK